MFPWLPKHEPDLCLQPQMNRHSDRTFICQSGALALYAPPDPDMLGARVIHLPGTGAAHSSFLAPTLRIMPDTFLQRIEHHNAFGNALHNAVQLDFPE